MSDPSHIYYDMNYNNYQSTTVEPSQLEFKETRNIPLIYNPNDYTMSIIRFQLDTPSLPSYIASIQPNQADVNLMIHSINLSYVNAGVEGNFIAPTYLVWKPVHKEVPIPPAPSANADGFQTDSIYYYGYSFHNFALIVNTALATALTALKVATGGGASPITTATNIFMYFDKESKCFVLVGDNAFYNCSTNANPHIRLYFNRPLYGLMSSFFSYRYPITDPNNNIYHIRMCGERGTNFQQNIYWEGGVPPTAPTKTYIVLRQEYPTTSNFSPVNSIVFTTTTLPVVPNQMSAPLTFNNNQLVSDANQNSISAQIITDMSNNDDFSYKPNLLYAPSAEFRRITLNSNRPLNSVDVKVFWKDRKGTLRPFYLWSGGSASIKLLFEKKKTLLLK
jgi:hypothetical protein